jgi:deazaflavin-dependent oxidoreductase (nitroreductase family)
MEMPGWMASAMLRLGMLAQITVVGRKSGLERTAIVNKKSAPGGGYYVVAGDESHQWARNLRAAGRCKLTVKGATAELSATELEDDERLAAARSLAPPFTSADKAVAGPIFRLDPVD